MLYSDFSIDLVLQQMAEIFNKKSTPTRICGILLEASEIIRQLRQAAAPPPNAPLTLEELREMDGQPVWIERPGYGAKWALVNVWAKATNIIYLTCNNGMPLHLLPELESGAKIYCRPPKEEA